VDGDLRIMDGATAILQNVHMAHAVTVEPGGTLDARDSLVRRRSLLHPTGLSREIKEGTVDNVTLCTAMYSCQMPFL
jgi:hypothetical protein